MNTKRIGNAFTHSGKLPFSNLICFVLQSVHKSIPINYSRFLDTFPSGVPPFVSKQAVSKARQGISHKAFLELFRLSVEQFYLRTADLRTWNNFHLRYCITSFKLIIVVSFSYIDFSEEYDEKNIFKFFSCLK